MLHNDSSKPGRRHRASGLFLLFALVVAGLATVPVWRAIGAPVGPDVTVIRLDDIQNYGSSGGIQGYAVGTTSCNVGTEPVWWCNDAGDTFCQTNQHPVIAQNMYRLKDGRFEQIGMSWLKHGFLSTNTFEAACGSCQGPPHGGDQLGIGCTDTYGAGLNGSRPLGKRSEVNPATGAFPYPYGSVGTSTAVDQRVQVLQSEIDPATNAGARYWVEGHYIAADDAVAGNAFNNASYREVSVSAGSFNLSFIGSTVREATAISVWQVVDPTVELEAVDVPGTTPVERFEVARKVTDLGGGVWHYEYAVHNLNSDRAARLFQVSFPAATTFSNVGFRDVNHHSGEPYATTDWPSSTTANAISWSTDTFDVDANANALRWATMFSFWFDATAAPAPVVNHSLGLFKNGSPQSVTFRFGGPDIFADDFESGNTGSWSDESP